MCGLLVLLTVLVSTITNSQVSLLNNVSIFCKLHFFFSKNISINAIFNNQNFDDTLTNDIVSFEQLDPVCKYFLLNVKIISIINFRLC